MKRLTSAQSEFVESVLSLKPLVAAFDCDGTLWSGDAGEGFFSWELELEQEKRLVSEEIARWARSRYADYKAGLVDEDTMCGEMVTMHRGLREEVVQQAAHAYFAQSIAPNIFPEMCQLVQRLRASGCDVWAVSSTCQWVIRSGMRYFGIPNNRVLAAEVAVENGAIGRTISDRLIRVPSGPGKPEAIRSVLKSAPDCAFGNAIWDREMLAMSKHPFAINPNPDLKEIAIANDWTVYQPDTNHAGRQQVQHFSCVILGGAALQRCGNCIIVSSALAAEAEYPSFECRADMQVSTLHDFVKAMGGELKITAKFPEGTVEITQFEDVKKAAAGKD